MNALEPAMAGPATPAPEHDDEQQATVTTPSTITRLGDCPVSPFDGLGKRAVSWGEFHAGREKRTKHADEPEVSEPEVEAKTTAPIGHALAPPRNFDDVKNVLRRYNVWTDKAEGDHEAQGTEKTHDEERMGGIWTHSVGEAVDQLRKQDFYVITIADLHDCDDENIDKLGDEIAMARYFDHIVFVNCKLGPKQWRMIRKGHRACLRSQGTTLAIR
jgi:hypothetical protein